MENAAVELQESDTAGETARQFIAFRIEDQRLAVDMGIVQEIVRMPPVVQVPLSPDSIRGLANLRGQVLPIIDLRRLTDLPQKEADDATRVIVVKHSTPIGFVVDKVSRSLAVERDRIEDAEQIQSLFGAEMLEGLVKESDEAEVIQVIDFQRVIEAEFETMLRDGPGETAQLRGRAEGESVPEEASEDVVQLISFTAAHQEFALPISQVKEIVHVPDHISEVPKAVDYVLGLMTLRDRVLPLVSLRQMLGLEPVAVSSEQRVVVLPLDGDRRGNGPAVGVVMDSVNEVLRVPSSRVEAIPELLSQGQEMGEIEAICRLGKGERLVSVLSRERLFSHHVMREAIESVSEMEQETEENEEVPAETVEDDAEEQFVVFQLDDEEYGVPIREVKEIVRVPEQLTRVPKASALVEGVINLRGAVLPVIDQRRRFGLPSAEESDKRRILVLRVNGHHAGFIVDAVTEVRRVPSWTVDAAPTLSNEQSSLIGRVANLTEEQRMIMLLDPQHLLDEGERESLQDVVEGEE